MAEVSSFKEYIENGLEDKIHDFTKENNCSNCGNCCTNALPMSNKEVDRIKKYIKSNKITEQKHLSPLAKAPIDWTCPFRDDKNNICTIYEVRPKVCRLFICNDSEKAKSNREKLANTTTIRQVRREFFGTI